MAKTEPEQARRDHARKQANKIAAVRAREPHAMPATGRSRRLDREADEFLTSKDGIKRRVWNEDTANPVIGEDADTAQAGRHEAIDEAIATLLPVLHEALRGQAIADATPDELAGAGFTPRGDGALTLDLDAAAATASRHFKANGVRRGTSALGIKQAFLRLTGETDERIAERSSTSAHLVRDPAGAVTVEHGPHGDGPHPNKTGVARNIRNALTAITGERAAGRGIAIERTLRRAEEVADHRTLEDYEAALRGIPVLGAGAFVPLAHKREPRLSDSQPELNAAPGTLAPMTADSLKPCEASRFYLSPKELAVDLFWTRRAFPNVAAALNVSPRGGVATPLSAALPDMDDIDQALEEMDAEAEASFAAAEARIEKHHEALAVLEAIYSK